MGDYNRLYFYDFKLSDRELELIDLAKKYHELCDSFDDSVCTGKNEYGESTPQNNDQFIAINRNAAQVRKRIIETGVNIGFSKNEISQAINKYFHK